MTLRLYILLSLLCFGFYAQAQQVNVSAALDSSKILIGDQINLHLLVSHPPGATITYPILTKENLGGLEIIKEGKADTLKSSPEVFTQKDITISAYDSGYYVIPGLSFSYTLANGQNSKAFTSPLALEVMTVSVDTLNIAPIKALMEEPFMFEDVLPFLYVLGGLLLAIFIGYFIYKKWLAAQEQEEEVPEVILPAHAIALQNLDQLKAKKLWQQGNVKGYQSELTYIVRTYIEDRFKKPALESTTEEILDSLKELAFSGDVKSKLREMLQLADLVKFAKADPPAEHHEKVLQSAYEFVDLTKKIEEEIIEEKTTEEETLVEQSTKEEVEDTLPKEENIEDISSNKNTDDVL